MKYVLIFVAVFTSLLFLGCSPNIVRYVADEPKYKDINIEEINSDEEIVEISEAYKKEIDKKGLYWVVILKDDEHFLNKIDLMTGKITRLNQKIEYDPDQPIYWDMFTEDKMDVGESCIGGCLAATPIGGTTSKYGFNAEKMFWGDPDHKVNISYAYSESRSSTSSTIYTTTSQGSTQKFIKNDKIVDINVFNGYVGAFSLGVANKIRYFPVDKNNYIGVQPNSRSDINTITCLAYVVDYSNESANQKSFGADFTLPVPYYYIDAGVTKDGNTLSMVLLSGKKYILRKYPCKEFTKNIKLLRTVQE